MAAEQPPAESRSGPPFPGLGALRTAFAQLTVLGARARSDVDAAAVYYPLVGAVLGALWLAVDALVRPRAGAFAASVAVACVAAAATRAAPLAALGRSVAALLARSNARQRLACGNRLLDHACAFTVFALEVLLLNALGRYRPIALIFAPLLGACSMVVIAVGSRAARLDGRLVKFAPAVSFREFGIATTATFAVVFLAADFLGLLLVLTTAALTIAARVGWHRWMGGVSYPAMLATAEAVQIAILAVLVAIRP
jgi:adenosylcobinamide-GDP ribazoletransferase